MKKTSVRYCACFIAFVLLSVTQLFAQRPENLLGTWSGKYLEEGANQLTIDYSLVIERVTSEGDPIIDVKYQNRSDGRKDSHARIKAYYQYVEGSDAIVFGTSTYIKGTKKMCAGNLVFIVNSVNGKRNMVGYFSPSDKSLVPNYIRVELTNTKDIEQPYQNTDKISSGTIAQTKSTGGKKVIHFASTPVVIDGDLLYNFNDGYAVVGKGTSLCLIDQTGKTIFPYNKYKYLTNPQEYFAIDKVKNGRQPDYYGFDNGFLIVQDLQTNLWGAYDKNLKVVIPFKYNSITDNRHSGYFRAYTDAVRNIPGSVDLYDVNGKKIDYSKKPLPFIGITMRTNFDGKSTYADEFSNFRDIGIYDRTSPFSEGLAAVAKKDEFGILKWGYINTEGKLIIPYTFTIPPGEFHDNRALVQPAIKTDFDYAYIDRSGKVVFTFKEDKDCSIRVGATRPLNYGAPVRKKGIFLDGYSLWEIHCTSKKVNNGLTLVDTLGNRRNFLELLKSNGWPHPSFTSQSEFQNGEIIITSGAGLRPEDIYAIANTKGEILLSTTFGEEGVPGMMHSTFDPISGLVRFNTPIIKGKPTYGYCDRNGVIKIILGEPGKW